MCPGLLLQFSFPLSSGFSLVIIREGYTGVSHVSEVKFGFGFVFQIYVSVTFCGIYRRLPSACLGRGWCRLTLRKLFSRRLCTLYYLFTDRLWIYCSIVSLREPMTVLIVEFVHWSTVNLSLSIVSLRSADGYVVCITHLMNGSVRVHTIVLPFFYFHCYCCYSLLFNVEFINIYFWSIISLCVLYLMLWSLDVQRMEERRLPKKLWNGAHQEEKNEVDLNLPGRKRLEDWWRKRD